MIILNYNSERRAEDCDIFIVEPPWRNFSGGSGELPDIFSKERKPIAVYTDTADGIITNALDQHFKGFDYILRTHSNSNFPYPLNFPPWASSLSNPIIDSTKDGLIYKEKRK